MEYNPMLFASTDLGVQIDYGSDKPGMVLLRLENGACCDYRADGRQVVNPFKVDTLPAGRYRLVGSET
jgi:hypothetical protein